MAFRVRSEPVDDKRGNFKDKYMRTCAICQKWQDLRLGMRINKIEDLVIFLPEASQRKSEGQNWLSKS